MRVIFAGTPAFAAASLDALVQAGHEVVLVLTQPDRPAGRGMRLQPSAVKTRALAHGLAIAQPQGLRLDGRYSDDAAAARARIDAAQADVMVVAAYGLILPQWVLDAPRLGCLNVHASLLPRWRGAAPIHRAVEAGDTETGITIMQMDAGLDTGDMLLQAALPIAPHHDTATLHDALASLGATLLVDALRRQLAGELVPTVQPTEGVTYAHKIEKQEAAIDWTQPADALRRQVKAFNPFPGATGQWLGSPSGELLKIWDAETVHLPVTGALSHALAGTVVDVSDQGLDIRCGDTSADGQLPVLRLTVLQRAGGKRLPVAVLLNGFTVHIGETFLVSAGEPS